MTYVRSPARCQLRRCQLIVARASSDPNLEMRAIRNVSGERNASLLRSIRLQLSIEQCLSISWSMDYSGYPPHGAAQETAPSLPESYASGTGLNQPQHPAYGYDQTQYGQYEADQPYHQSNAANAPMYQMSGQGPQSASQGYDTYQGTGSIPQQGLNQPNYYQAQMGSGAGHQSAVPNGTTFQNLNGSNYQTNGLVNSDVVSQKSRRISKKWQRRLYWSVVTRVLFWKTMAEVKPS